MLIYDEYGEPVTWRTGITKSIQSIIGFCFFLVMAKKEKILIITYFLSFSFFIWKLDQLSLLQHSVGLSEILALLW